MTEHSLSPEQCDRVLVGSRQQFHLVMDSVWPIITELRITIGPTPNPMLAGRSHSNADET